VAELVGTYER
jgi:hypothetical protein